MASTDFMNEAAKPDNVVNLNPPDPGDQFTTKAGMELAERRKALFRAFELTGKQLEHDAGRMVQASILGEHEVKHRIELMDKARCLYVSVGWLQALIEPVAPTAAPPKGAA